MNTIGSSLTTLSDSQIGLLSEFREGLPNIALAGPTPEPLGEMLLPNTARTIPGLLIARLLSTPPLPPVLRVLMFTSPTGRIR